MKETLDKTEVARFHKMLKGDEENGISKKSIGACAKILGCSVNTLKGLTPEAYEEFNKKQKELEKKLAKERDS